MMTDDGADLLKVEEGIGFCVNFSNPLQSAILVVIGYRWCPPVARDRA